MKLGIVGSEAAKFTLDTERAARREIRRLLGSDVDLVISGHSPLGGVDLWAIEEAQWAGIRTREYAPKHHSWGAIGGYRDRNLLIATGCDLVVCITLKQLPASYRGMTFPHGCYHCGTPPEHHVKSGGCWTLKQAQRAGKRTELVIIGLTGVDRLSTGSGFSPTGTGDDVRTQLRTQAPENERF